MFLALQRFPTARLPGQGKGTHHLCPPGAGPHLPATRTAPPFPGKRAFSVDALATEPRGLRPRREWRKKPSSAPSHRGRGRECAQQRPPPHLPAPATRATTIAQQAPLPPAGVSSPRPDPRPGRDRPTRPDSARLGSPYRSSVTAIASPSNRHVTHDSRLGNANPRNHCFPLSSRPLQSPAQPTALRIARSGGRRARTRPASRGLTPALPNTPPLLKGGDTRNGLSGSPCFHPARF